jgi:hypothetical protein
LGFFSLLGYTTKIKRYEYGEQSKRGGGIKLLREQKIRGRKTTKGTKTSKGRGNKTSKGTKNKGIENN